MEDANAMADQSNLIKPVEDEGYSIQNLVRHLKTLNLSKDYSLLDLFKIRYRPFVCPLHIIIDKIPKRKKVFDFGCGHGVLLSLVSSFKSPLALGGAEISERLVSSAKKLVSRNNDIPVNTYRIKEPFNIPDEIKNYDFVLMIDVLHHVPKKFQKLLIKNLFDKMSPGTTILFKDIDGARVILNLFNILHDMILSNSFVHAPASNIVHSWFNDSGMHILSSSSFVQIVYPHYMITAQKTT
jgi:2-polyprenyl-3-methyl-5-hydroxy-6-metoxy-1,4-benzoquinol methylase